MSIAILEPFSGISGDMTLGGLVAVGLETSWLQALPSRLGLDGVGVRVTSVQRSQIACTKVDFDIPEQPHGRHLAQIRDVVERSEAPREVKERADAAFTAIAEVEANLHGTTVDRVHLHEVGAVDAILDVVGSIWGLSELGVSRVYCSVLNVGDGFVRTAHGMLPVPAPATLRLLEGHVIRPGPEGAGELVTPTGAALVRVLSEGPPPAYVPRRSGYGAGTKDFPDRPNALRVTLADAAVGVVGTESLVLLGTDLDDMSAEHVANASERLRELGALDVTTTSLQMKKGRLGVRIEVLSRPEQVGRLEEALFATTTTLGIRRTAVERRALHREQRTVSVLGHDVRVKLATLPGGRRRGKAEYEDVRVVSRATGRSLGDVASLALAAAERD
ncbi:MAG TPA: nickel pincer cofactor biosynthesis protein LarC [Gemmatimonadaceae bacterium]